MLVCSAKLLVQQMPRAATVRAKDVAAASFEVRIQTDLLWCPFARRYFYGTDATVRLGLLQHIGFTQERETPNVRLERPDVLEAALLQQSHMQRDAPLVDLITQVRAQVVAALAARCSDLRRRLGSAIAAATIGDSTDGGQERPSSAASKLMAHTGGRIAKKRSKVLSTLSRKQQRALQNTSGLKRERQAMDLALSQLVEVVEQLKVIKHRADKASVAPAGTQQHSGEGACTHKTAVGLTEKEQAEAKPLIRVVKELVAARRKNAKMKPVVKPLMGPTSRYHEQDISTKHRNVSLGHGIVKPSNASKKVEENIVEKTATSLLNGADAFDCSTALLARPCEMMVHDDPLITASPLNAEQQQVLELCLGGHSVYIGGNAGTGKSFVLRHIIHHLSVTMQLHVAVTATTGIAALNIDGITLHSQFGLRPRCGAVPAAACAAEDSDVDAEVLSHVKQFDANLLAALDVVVIDEVSMLPPSILIALDIAARAVRVSTKPFGGIQLLLSGDFLQLGTVTEENALIRSSAPSSAGGASSHLKYIFSLPLFKQNIRCVALTQQLRQSSPADAAFTAALQELREGKAPPMVLSSHARNPPAANPIRLYPRRSEAIAFNTSMMLGLDAEEHIYRLRVEIHSFNRPKPCPPAERHEDPLKGAVCFEYTVGHSCGLSERVVRERLSRMVLGSSDGSAAMRPAAQKTLNFARKPSTNGGAFDRVVVSPASEGVSTQHIYDVLRQAEVSGLVTDVATRHRDVAGISDIISKLRSESLYSSRNLKQGCQVMLVRNLTPSLVNGSIGVVVGFSSLDAALLPPGMTKLQQFYHRVFGNVFAEGSVLFPLVKFDGAPTPIQIPYVGFSVAHHSTACVAFVMPLVPAYAFTCHKIQGLTLDHPVQFECRKMWPCEHMVYTAASRVKSFAHLRILNLKPNHIIVDPVALSFTQSLPTPADALRSAAGSTQRAAWFVRKLCSELPATSKIA